jgi:murein DD-endopeptidase MepM/ murein hydrolase activator NlpD
LPDSQWPLRRLTPPRALSRAFAHLAVIGLVAFTATFAIAAAKSPSPDASASASAEPELAFSMIDRARAADGPSPDLRSVTFELQPNPGSADPIISRRVARFEATPAPTPLPTPVAPPPPAPDRPKVAAAKPAPVTGSGTLAWPVRGVITTYYSASHLAIDIAAPAGTTVHASDAGVVTYAGWRNNGGGNVIQIDHGNGIQTVYNHLGSIWVSVGQSVAPGEGIGAVGCTGNCTGPHVHFEVIVNGVIVNPLRYL